MIRTCSALALLLAACSGTAARVPEGPEGPPQSFEGFPSQTLEGIVYAQARYRVDHKDAIGVDLVRAADIVPVSLTVQLRGEGQSEAQILLSSDTLGAQLFLQDGTLLEGISADEVAERVNRRWTAAVVEAAFRPDLLRNEPLSGFLYFDLGSVEGSDLDGKVLSFDAGEQVRVVDLTRSLLAFNVSVERALQPFFVGISR